MRFNEGDNSAPFERSDLPVFTSIRKPTNGRANFDSFFRKELKVEGEDLL